MAVLIAWQFVALLVVTVTEAFPVPPSTSAPVRFVALPGSARRSPDAFPAGIPVDGKFPVTLAILVEGETAQACAYDTILFLPVGPTTAKSAPAAMSEFAS